MRELLDRPRARAARARGPAILARAEGIPLYAVETIRMLVADGRLLERADGIGPSPLASSATSPCPRRCTR